MDYIFVDNFVLLLRFRTCRFFVNIGDNLCSFSCLRWLESKLQAIKKTVTLSLPYFPHWFWEQFLGEVGGSLGKLVYFNLSLISKGAKVLNMGIYMKTQGLSYKSYIEHLKLYEIMDCVCRMFFLVLDLHQYSCYLRGPRFGKLLGLFRAQRLRQMLLQCHSDFSFD